MATHSPLEAETDRQLVGAIPAIPHHDIYVIADRPPFRDYTAEFGETPTTITVYYDLYFYDNGAWTTITKNFQVPGTLTGGGGGEG